MPKNKKTQIEKLSKSIPLPPIMKTNHPLNLILLLNIYELNPLCSILIEIHKDYL
jgi:hypothetical protein